MNTNLVKINPDELQTVVNNSGLDIQEGEQIKQSFLPFIVQLSEIQEQSVKINFENPTSIDETIARELRLKTVKIRTGASDLKDSRKKIHLLKGNVEQASYNLIAASCKLAEETFLNVEKAREIAETKRKAELKLSRESEVQELVEFIPFGINLGNLSDDDFDKLKSGAMLLLQAKRDKEAQEEAEAKRKLEITNLHNSRKETLLPLWNFMPENYKLINFGMLETFDFECMVDEVEGLKKTYDDKQEEIRKENERLKKEREKAEKERKEREEKLRAEREENERKLKVQQEESERILLEERKKADEKLRLQEEARKLAKELQDKKDADLKAQQEEQKKLLEQKKAEEKAAKAPDKEKLSIWINSFAIAECPIISKDLEPTAKVIEEKFKAFKTWALTQIENI